MIAYEQLLKVFWESHDPTQGMRQGNDVGTQYRSGDLHLPPTRSSRRPRRRATLYQDVLTAAGYGEITTEILPAPAVLLRRGLPPAVPGEEPGRLLRPRRHRRELPGRPRRDRTGTHGYRRLTHGRRLDRVVAGRRPRRSRARAGTARPRSAPTSAIAAVTSDAA